MQQKMEFLAASQALREPPSDEEIEAFFALRRERYRVPASLTFAQVYVSPDARGAAAEGDAEALLVRLRRDDPAPAEIAGWGDPIMLEPVYRGAGEREIRSTFGDEFAQRIVALAPGSWEGPVPSGYGLHLVKVLDRVDSRIPDWREVEGRVVADMEFEARTSSRDQLYQEIAQNYQIVFDAQVRDLLNPAE